MTKTSGLHAQLVWFNIDTVSIYENTWQMHKKPRLITQFATILVICMGALLLYVWLNYDNLRSEQAYRQMWYLNHKFDSN